MDDQCTQYNVGEFVGQFERAVVSRTHAEVAWEVAMQESDFMRATSELESFRHWAGIAAGLELQIRNLRSWDWSD